MPENPLIVPNAAQAVFNNVVMGLGDLAYDTTLKAVRIGDGVTPGGRIIPDNVGIGQIVAAAITGKANIADVTASFNDVATALAGKATTAQGSKADSALQPGAEIDQLVETTGGKIMTASERAGLADLRVTIRQADGSPGIVFADGFGNEFGFIPMDAARALQFPSLSVAPTKAKMGPLDVSAVDASDGIALVDQRGREFGFIPLGVDRDLLLPYLQARGGKAQLGPLRVQSYVGPNGIALVDSLGDEFGFIPFDALQGLRLPYVRANATALTAGPLTVKMIEGVDGVVFVDAVGNGVAPPSASGGTAGLDKAASLKIAAPANSVVTQGHSKTQQNSWGGTANVTNPNGGTARRADVGWLGWMDYYLRGSINWLWNAGVGGEQDSSILARMQNDVVAKNPAWCFMMGGTCNSINAGKTAAQIIATQIGTETEDSSSSILGVLQGAGIKTMWLTDPTWYTGHPDLTDAKVAILNQANRALLRAMGYKSGLIAVDTASAIVDPLSPTGAARQFYLQDDDNIHEAPLGARVMGYLAAQRALACGFPMMDILVASIADRYGTSPTSKQLLENPLMLLGAGGAISQPATASGSVPEGWRLAVSGTWGANMITSALVARADGFGNDWIVTVTNSGADGDVLSLIGPDIRSLLITGDVVEAAAQVDITGMTKVKGSELRMDLAANTPSSFTAISTLERDATVNGNTGWGHQFYSQADLVGGVMKTGKAPVPPGTLESYSGSVRLRLTFGGAGGTAIIRMSRAQLLKNS